MMIIQTTPQPWMLQVCQMPSELGSFLRDSWIESFVDFYYVILDWDVDFDILKIDIDFDKRTFKSYRIIKTH